MALHPTRPRESDDEYLEVRPEFASDLASAPLPRLRLPESSTAPRVAYQLVHDELMLDGNPRLNLATFVTTWMEPEARALIDESYSVYDLSEAVRKRGWIVPAYPMPRDLEDMHVLRVVVRNGFGRDLARTFVDDLRRAVEHLEGGGGRVEPGDRAGFHH